MIYTIVYKEELWGPYNVCGDDHIKRSNPFLRMSIYQFIKSVGDDYGGEPINAVFHNSTETDVLVFTSKMFKGLNHFRDGGNNA